MATIEEISAEINRNILFLEGNEGYLRKALEALKHLSSQMRREKKRAGSGKITIKSESMPIDKYIGVVSPNCDDDKKTLEEYLSGKYGI